MGYCTVQDVETFCPARAPFGAGSRPSASGVARLIEVASREVNDHLLRAGYAAPVATSATYAFQQLGDATAKITAYMVEQVAPTSGGRDSIKQMRDAALKMIDDGELVGIDKDIQEAGPRSNFGTATAVFTRDMTL